MSHSLIHDLINIAKETNAMNDIDVRQRLKELERIQVADLSFEELMEINYLALKILSFVK